MIPLLSQSDVLLFLFEHMQQQGSEEGMTATVSKIRKSLNSTDFDSNFFINLKNPELNQKNVLEIMKTYNISPEIDQNELQRFSDSIENVSKHDMLLEVVYFYIIWIMIPNIIEKNSFGIEILNFILKIDDVDQENKSKSLYLSVSFYIIQAILKNNEINSFEQIKLIIIMLFDKHKLSEEYTVILGLAIKTITSTNPDSISVDDMKLLAILHNYYISNDTKIPIKTTQLVYGALTPLIYNLNNFVLKFISEISSKVPETISMIPVNLFPAAILKEIQNENKFFEINLENVPNYEPIIRKNHEEVTMQFSTKRNINIDNLDLTTKQLLPDRLSYHDIFDISFIDKLSLISLFFKTNLNLIEIFIENSFDFLTAIDQKYYMHYILAMCIIMNDIKPNQFFLNFIKNLYQSKVFDPRISIYHNTEDSFISTIRWSAFDVLNLDSTAFIFDALEILFSQPYMYSELLLKLSIGQTYLQVKFKKEIIELLCDHFHEYKEESNEQAPIARGNIILFISRLLTDISYLNNFFSTEHQTTIFLSGLFENSLTSFTIHGLRTYLTNTEVFSKNLCSLLGNCLRICCLSPSENGLPVYIKILSALNDVQKIRKQVCEYLISLRTILCSNLCEICHRKDYDNLEEILYQCLNFFTSSSQIVKATREEVSSFETMLEIFSGRKIPKRLFNETVQVIAGQFLSSYAPKYIIMEPNFLRFLLQIYKNEDFKIAIKFIQDLCSHASVNIMICHQFRIDILLIELLSKQRLLENPNLEYVNSCLDLFKTIASFVSSVTVSQRYVSLFAPLNNSNISYLEPVFIKGLTDILQQTYRIPSGFIELKPGGQIITIDGLNGENLNNPFCFVTWFRINYSVPKYSPNIFTIYDSNHNIIKGTISCDEITITVRNNSRRSIGKVEEQMPLNTWTFLSILFIKANERFEAFVNFNNRSRSYCLPFPSVNFSGDAKIVVGGADVPSGFEVKKFVSLSSFGILNINSNDQSSEIESIGPQLDKMPQTDYTFLVRVTSANKVLNLSLITNQNLNLSYTGTPSRQISMIYDCLVNMSGVDLLMPLFSLIDFTFPNGKPFSDSFQLIYELLYIVVVNSEIAQKNMSETNCVEILEYLLQNNDKKLLNYVTFNKFYLLLQKINDSGLQFKLAKYILLNYNLWSSSTEFNQIIKSWHRKLIPFIANLKIKVFDFVEILTHLVMNKCDYEIKKHLTDVLLDIASIEFKQNDLTVLISHIAKISAKENCLFLLNLLEKILMLQNTPITNLDYSDLCHIIFVIGLRDKQITMKMISIIVIASKILKNISLYEICDSIIQLLRNDDANNELYEFLFDLVNNCFVYELLSLLSWCSLNLGEEKVKNTFDNLKPDEKFICNLSWMTWPLISAIVYPNISVYVLNFLIEISPKCWLATDANLCFLESVFKYNCEEFRRSFISILTNKLVMHHGNEDEMNKYYHILLMYLTRHKRSPNKALHDLIKNHLNYQNQDNPQTLKSNNEKFDKVEENSQEKFDKNENFDNLKISDKVEDISKINVSNDVVEGNNNLDNSVSNEEIFKLEISSPLDFYLCNNNFDGVKYDIFGLRIVKNGTWLDLNLVQSFLQFLAENNENKLISTFLYFYYCCKSMIKSEIIENFYNTKLSMLNLQEFNIKQSEIIERIVNLTKHISDLYEKYIIELSNWFKNSFDNTLKLIDKTEQKYPSIVNSSILQTKNRLQSHSIFCQKSWSSLWHRMKSNNGPWNIEGQTPHYKKSPIPSRLSYHWNYNDHLDAMIKREIYSNSSSEVIETLRNKLMKQSSSKSIVFDTDYDNSFNYDFNESKLIFKTNNCQKVYLKKKVDCSICIYKNGIKYIVNDVITMISSDLIKRISPMKYNHKENSIEILTWNGKLLFFVFPDENNSQILNYFKYMTLNHGIIEGYDEFRFIKEYTEKWQNNHISTFDYILEINHFACRTFADITQYPIFPWILSNYSSETKELDLSSDENYRDLSKPPSSISPEKSVKIYNDFEFSQGISTPGEISAFMLRMEPFSTIKINLNGGFFDRKIFSSLEEEWNNFIIDPNDTRELIPEFFSFPEMFLNINHLYLNHMLENVLLPGYCNSPDEFVYLNRKALESTIVSQKIHHWIDFTFGILQRKQKSCEYRKELYDDIFDSNPNEDFVDICCLNLGQMPKQVFTSNHLERNKTDSDLFKTKRLQHGIKEIVSSSFHNNELLILTAEDIITIKLKNPHDINKNNIIYKTKSHKKHFDDCQICYFIDDFVVSNEINQSIEYVCSNKSLSIRGGISTLSSSDYLLCVGTFAATSHVYLGRDFIELCDCETFLGEVVCSFVSSKYFVVVSCTSSCSLVIHELDGEYLHSVQLDSFPKSVLVTENLGFIVVYSESVSRGQTKHFLNVFNINGRSIISKEFPNEIKGILSVKDKQHIDYLLYIDCENKVYTLETFYLSNLRCLLTIEGEFISLHYMKDEDVVLILTDKYVYVLDHLF